MTNRMEIFLKKTGIRDSSIGQINMLELIKSSSYETLTKYLTRINGIIQKNGRSFRGFEKDQKYSNILNYVVDSVAYISPHVDDKDDLLKKVHESAKGISDAKDVALLVYLAIQAIHPFRNGNGRTGREVFYLITQPHERLSDEERSRNYFQGNLVRSPEAINRYINIEVLLSEIEESYRNLFFSVNIADIPIRYSNGNLSYHEIFNTNIPLEDCKICYNILTEDKNSNLSFRKLVLMKYFQDFNISLDSILKNRTLNLKELIGSFTPENLQRIIQIHRDLKVKFVEKLIDIIKNPSKYKSENEFIKDSFFVKKQT